MKYPVLAFFGLVLSASFAQAAIPPNPYPQGSPFTDVTRDYGPLVVKYGDQGGEAAKKPWSSWWYPNSQKTLFEGSNSGPSTLERYDQYRNSRGFYFSAADWEKDRFDPSSESWSGLCDAFAIAAIVEKEPVQSVVKDGVQFDVGDLKGLLLKTYQNVKGIPSYGQRFNGTYDAYNHPDLYPDQFHRFIQSEVIGKQRAFVLDYDPGVAVWNVPAFKILSRVIKEPTNINQVNVTTWVTYADMKVDDTDFVGTMETTLIYKYKLYGTPRADGTFAVSWGEWVEESRWDHPDFVLAIDPARIQRSVVNPEISSQTVDEILNGSR